MPVRPLRPIVQSLAARGHHLPMAPKFTTKTALGLLSLLFVYVPTMRADEVPAPAPGAPATAPTTPDLAVLNGDKLLLRLKLREGQSFPMRMYSTTKTAQTIQGHQIDMYQVMELALDYKVTSVDAVGQATINATFHPRRMKVTAAGHTMEFVAGKTKASPENPLAGMMSALDGATLTTIQSPDGRVQDIQGMDALWDRMAQQIPGGTVMSKSMKDQFGDSMLQTMGTSLGGYPEAPVGLGETWTRKLEGKGMFGQGEVTSTLRSRKNGRAIIGMTAAMHNDPNAMPLEMAGAILKMALSNTSQGWYEIDESTGWPVSAQYDFRGQGRMTVTNPKQNPSTISWPIYMKGSVRLAMPGVPVPAAPSASGSAPPTGTKAQY